MLVKLFHQSVCTVSLVVDWTPSSTALIGMAAFGHQRTDQADIDQVAWSCFDLRGRHVGAIGALLVSRALLIPHTAGGRMMLDWIELIRGAVDRRRVL